MAGTLTISTLNDSSGVLATQNGMTGIAKAWVNFSAASGTITVNNSFNVGSVTRSAAGQYAINFTTAMATSFYSTVASCHNNTTGTPAFSNAVYGAVACPNSTTVCNVTGYGTATNAYADLDNFSVAIFSA
jgi:hypothetical protein